jgi:hypothetical protein
MSKMNQIPKFKNEAEEREFWEKHDSTEYVDWTLAQRGLFPNLKHGSQEMSKTANDPNTGFINSSNSDAKD